MGSREAIAGWELYVSEPANENEYEI